MSPSDLPAALSPELDYTHAPQPWLFPCVLVTELSLHAGMVSTLRTEPSLCPPLPFILTSRRWSPFSCDSRFLQMVSALPPASHTFISYCPYYNASVLIYTPHICSFYLLLSCFGQKCPLDHHGVLGPRTPTLCAVNRWMCEHRGTGS